MRNALLVLMWLIISGCSESTTGDDGGSTDGSRIDGGGGGGACPASPPAAGSSCRREGLTCAYGDDPRVACRQRFTCTMGSFVDGTMRCDPLPPVTCPPTREMAIGDPCSPEGAACSYEGLGCTCTTCPEPYPVCMPLPSAVWACQAPNPDPECPPAIPNLGTACERNGQLCSYGCEAGMDRECESGVWAERSAPGGCPISTRRAKRDIRYLSSGEGDALARDMIALPVATFEYVDPALAGRRRLGFILEDGPPGFAVDPERSQVDLYGYASLLLVTLQAQERRIEALERELSGARGGEAPFCE